MQKEPTVFAMAIGCEQLLLHNRRVSSVYIAGGFHMSPHSTVPFTLKVLIHGLKKTKTKENETRKRLVCIFSCVLWLWLPLLAFPCKLHSWCACTAENGEGLRLTFRSDLLHSSRHLSFGVRWGNLNKYK